MATYNEIAALRRNQDFKDKVIVAIGSAANEIVGEDPTTAMHVPRLLWAQRVFAGPQGPDMMAEMMMWRVLQNTALQTAGTSALDADVQTVVNSLVNDFAARGL